MNESELISKAIQKDRNACKELFQTHKNQVFNAVLPILQNNQEAEDILQETFIYFFETLHSFKKESTLSTWIYRIAINKALESIRQKKRLKRFSFFSAKPMDEATQIESTWMHPFVLLEKKEHAKILFESLNHLKEKHKVAFTLFHIEGLPQKEIAEIMKTSVPAVETMIHRAKKELRAIIEKRI